MARFCANCGTEVDDSAAFCPTCGQPLDEASEMQMPAAPAWPEQPTPSPGYQAPRDEPDEAAADATGVEARTEPPSTAEPYGEWQRPAYPPPDQPAAYEPPPASAAGYPPPAPPPETQQPGTQQPAPATQYPPPPGAQPPPSTGPQVNLPITWPVMLSAWLIGGGALLAALGALINLFSTVVNFADVLLLVLMLGVAATVFFANNVPRFDYLRLATLAIALVGFGVALDRLGFGGSAGVGALLLFLGAAAASIGAILIELGRDQPLGGQHA
jgi:hypothetical protein